MNIYTRKVAPWVYMVLNGTKLETIAKSSEAESSFSYVKSRCPLLDKTFYFPVKHSPIVFAILSRNELKKICQIQ